MELLDSLRCADPVKFGGSITRQHKKFHTCQIGLGDAGVQLRGRGAARHHNCHRQTSCERSTERKKTRSALVKSNVNPQFAALRCGESERRRA
jgi:hypothetical protein